MNTSKFLVAVLTAAMLSTAPALFARDTEAQKKANEALQQKLNELNSQPGAPAPAAPAPAPQKPVPVTAPAPAPITTPAQPVVAPAPAAAPVPAAVAVQATPTPPVPTPAPAVEPVPVTPIEDPAVVKAREDALNRAMGKSGGFSEVPPPSNTGNATPAQLQVTSAKSPGSTGAKSPQPGEYKPLVAPASPLNAAKEAQLAELLQKYRADQITPEQYHAERAKILGTP